MSGKQFRKLREDMDLKQSELGALMDVSERGIRRWENGEVVIPKLAELALRYLAEKRQKKGTR